MLFKQREIKQYIKAVLKNIIFYCHIWKYAGSRFICPVCDKKFGKLLSKTGHWSIKGKIYEDFTPNAICPYCNSGIRHRFLWQFLKQKTNILKSTIKLLHVAPSDTFSKNISHLSNVEYIQADIDPQNSKTIKVDLRTMQFPDSCFDALICNHVLEHINEDRQAISEMYRVLKPGGWALISTPIYGPETFEDPEADTGAARERAYGNSGHVRLNGLDLGKKLSKAGFSVKLYSIEEVEGDYIDRTSSSQHLESDKYLFFCKKNIINNR